MLGPEKASNYQSLVTVLQWIVGIGRANIIMEVSSMSSIMALPCEGYLMVFFQMFSFLKSKHNGLMLDSRTVPEIDESYS